MLVAIYEDCIILTAVLNFQNIQHHKHIDSTEFGIVKWLGFVGKYIAKIKKYIIIIITYKIQNQTFTLKIQIFQIDLYVLVYTRLY